MEEITRLTQLAGVAATSHHHWQRLFEGLRENLPVDRICAAVQVDRYTAYLPRVAQVSELDPLLGRDGLFADREKSRAFEVLAEGKPYLVAEQDWDRHPDLAFYKVAVRSNLKFPVSFGGYPTVLNLWSRARNAFNEQHIKELEPVAAELSRSPFRFEPVAVGLALRGLKGLLDSRARALAA